LLLAYFTDPFVKSDYSKLLVLNMQTIPPHYAISYGLAHNYDHLLSPWAWALRAFDMFPGPSLPRSR
jgi:hypothetical protein